MPSPLPWLMKGVAYFLDEWEDNLWALQPTVLYVTDLLNYYLELFKVQITRSNWCELSNGTISHNAPEVNSFLYILATSPVRM